MRINRVIVILAAFLVFGFSAHAQSDCLPNRAIAGSIAKVLPGDANRLRDAPSTNGNPIGSIPPNSSFHVLEVGRCDGKVQWLRVRYKNLEGWTAESLEDVYFIEVTLSPPAVPAFMTAQIFGESDGFPIGRLSYSQDGSFATPLGVFRAGDTQPVFTLPQLYQGDQGFAQDYLIHPTNSDLVFVYVLDEYMELWNIANHQKLYEARYTGNGFSYQQRADFSGDGTTLFYTAPESSKALDLATLQDRDSLYATVGYSANRMVSGGRYGIGGPESFEDTDIHVHDLTTGDIRRVRRGTLVSDDVSAITPNDMLYVLRDFEGVIEVWDTNTWERISRTPNPYQTRERAISLAVSNRYAALLEKLTRSDRSILRLFDLSTHETIATLSFTDSLPNFNVGLAFSPSGEQLGMWIAGTYYTIDIAGWIEAGDVTLDNASQ